MEQSLLVRCENGKTYSVRDIVLGTGRSQCFEAIERESKRTFAIKFIDKKKLKNINSVNSEIDIMIRLKGHPRIVEYETHGENDHFVFIVMEKCDCSLADISPLDYLSLDTKMRFARQIVEACSFARENNVLHRDLKPGNILIKDGEIKLADFGLAVICRVSLNSASGSINYIAPEILRRESYGFPVDVWSLGCVLFGVFAGKPPFAPASDETIDADDVRKKIKTLDYAIPKTVPEPFFSIISKSLVLNPSERLAMRDVAEMARCAE